MKTQRVSGIIFLIFLIISVIPATSTQSRFVSPFFLNELAVVVWAIISFVQLKEKILLLIAPVFVVGAAQNIYLLEYLLIQPREETVLFLWAGFVILLLLMLFTGVIYNTKYFKEYSIRDKITWIVFIGALAALFSVAGHEDVKYLLIAFVVQMVLLLMLLMNMKYRPYVLIWEAWMLYSVLEIMKTLSLLEAA